jgi:hypothetical protein
MVVSSFRTLLLGAALLAAAPAAAQHHDEPAPRPSRTEHRDAPATRAPKGAPSLGLIAPPAPSVAPPGHGRSRAAGQTAHQKGHPAGEPHDAAPGEAAPDAAGGRRKVDVLKKTSSPADVAASINQRLAELAELRKTAPVGVPRRPSPKTETPATHAASAPAPKPVEPVPPAIRLRWRVPVTWPDELPPAGAS